MTAESLAILSIVLALPSALWAGRILWRLYR